MKAVFKVQFKQQYNSRDGRWVTCKLGTDAPEYVVKPDYRGNGFIAAGTWCQTEAEAWEHVEKLKKEWAEQAKAVTFEVTTAEGVESSGTTFGLDAWENKYLTLDLSQLEAAIESVRGSYSSALYKEAFFREFEHGRYSINEMKAKGWLEIIEDILNLTQHAATTEQVDAGVVEPENKTAVQAALTFDAIPSADEMRQRAEFLAAIAKDSGCNKAMIGGAPFFMAPMERALLATGITPVYAFSVRDSREEADGNGGVRKVNVFRHVGFVEASQ